MIRRLRWKIVAINMAMVTAVLLAVFVGLVIMASELALGRKTGLGVVGAYHAGGPDRAV